MLKELLDQGKAKTAARTWNIHPENATNFGPLGQEVRANVAFVSKAFKPHQPVALIKFDDKAVIYCYSGLVLELGRGKSSSGDIPDSTCTNFKSIASTLYASNQYESDVDPDDPDDNIKIFLYSAKEHFYNTNWREETWTATLPWQFYANNGLFFKDKLIMAGNRYRIWNQGDPQDDWRDPDRNYDGDFEIFLVSSPMSANPSRSWSCSVPARKGYGSDYVLTVLAANDEYVATPFYQDEKEAFGVRVLSFDNGSFIADMDGDIQKVHSLHLFAVNQNLPFNLVATVTDSKGAFILMGWNAQSGALIEYVDLKSYEVNAVPYVTVDESESLFSLSWVNSEYACIIVMDLKGNGGLQKHKIKLFDEDGGFMFWVVTCKEGDDNLRQIEVRTLWRN